VCPIDSSIPFASTDFALAKQMHYGIKVMSSKLKQNYSILIVYPLEFSSTETVPFQFKQTQTVDYLQSTNSRNINKNLLNLSNSITGIF